MSGVAAAGFHRCDATALRAGYRAGEFSVGEVAEALLARVAAGDPALHAFLHLDPAAIRAAAAELDRRRGELIDRPLYGVPVAIKDNLSQRGVPTTAGSRILEGYRPLYDAAVVEGLRESAALLFGKTNLDEFAMGSSTENSAYGPTRNPWDHARVPGGSSGGSAAAVAAGFVPLALGSDTGGSIRQPAALTGVLGLKCTYGLVSRYGLIAYASSLDQVGPLGRSIDDLALALEAIAFRDRRDSTSVPDPRGRSYLPVPSAAAGGSAGGGQPLRGKRAGLPRELLGEGIEPGVRASVLGAVETLRGLGAQVDEISLPLLPAALPAYYIVATAEASSNLARFDGLRYGPQRAGPNLAAAVAATRGALFGAEVQRRILLGTFVLSAGYHDAYYLQAMKVRRLLAQQLAAALAERDFLVTPTSPCLAFRLGERTADPLAMYLADLCTIAVNLTGMPALSLPVAPVDGLPVGLQLIGPHFSERLLLEVGRALLAATGHHRLTPPEPPPSAPGRSGPKEVAA